MTPKEKAEELVKQMYIVHSNSASEITMYFAKQCALIAVDETIKTLNEDIKNSSMLYKQYILT